MASGRQCAGLARNQGIEAAKAGNCHDPEEEYAWRQMQVWPSAWSRSPGKPRTELNLRPRGTPLEKGAPICLDDVSESHRVGGRSRSPTGTPRKKGSQALSDRTLVAPTGLAPASLRSHEGRAQAGYRLAQLGAAASEAVMSKLANSTRQSYDAGWKQWCLFLSGAGFSPFLGGETRAERLADEQWLLRFVTFLHEVMRRTAQGIRQRLSAVRYAHIAAGYPDPLAGRVRLWAALQGFMRWETPRTRKVPVTPEMLQWIHSHLLQG